jgi:hypothetical protein
MFHAVNPQYLSPGWVKMGGVGDTSSNRYFLRLALPKQLAYQNLMAAYGGNPVCIECRAPRRQAWAFVLPEVRDPSRTRLQYFDQDGFSGDSAYDTLKDAVDTMIGEGFRIIDVGALDRIAATPRWARGVKVATLRQACQQGRMTTREFADAVKALDPIPA